MKNRFKIFIGICCLLLSILTIGQTPADDLKEYKHRYPTENFIYLNYQNTVYLTIKEGKCIAEVETFEERFFLTNKARVYANESIAFSSFNQLQSIEAYTAVPADKSYQKIKVESFEDEDVIDGGVFYDDSKVRKFIYPAIQTGAKTFVKSKFLLEDPRFLNSFFFGSYVPMEKAEYKVICDNNILLDVSYFFIDSINLNFKKEIGKKSTTYTWTNKDIKPSKREDNSPSIHYFMPHISARILNFNYKGEKINVLSTTQDLHNWYSNFIQKIEIKDNSELKIVVDSLILNKTTEFEKVKAIYYWVQNNVNYIAIEDGYSGFIPQNASEVCQNRYGDCKGMSNLIYEMLSLAGIKSYLTWIGTRDLNYKYDGTPTPLVDNHMIVTYINDTNYYFLDATGKNVSMNFTTAFIQGKQALIHIDNENYKIVTVPVFGSDFNTEWDTTFISIDSTLAIKGKAVHVTAGLNTMFFRTVLQGISNKDLKKYFERHYQKGNNKFSIDTFNVNNFYDKDENIIVAYEFNIDNYSSRYNDEIYINMILDKFYSDKKIDKMRELPIEIKYKSKNNLVTVLNIPKDYHLTYIPENSEYHSELFGFDVSYEKIGTQKLMVTYNLYENYLILMPDQFQEWNNMIGELKKSFGESIVLKQNNN